jgi:hypothetical protein
MARPRQITDEAILAIIDELRQPHRDPSGIAVRRALLERHGIRAGTDRVYRLLKGPPSSTPLAVVPQVSPTVRALMDERDAAVRRAELAEYREMATQERMARQIDELRQRLRSAGIDPFA